MVRLTDRPDMTLDVYRGRKTTMQQCNATTLISSNYICLEHIFMVAKVFEPMKFCIILYQFLFFSVQTHEATRYFLLIIVRLHIIFQVL